MLGPGCSTAVVALVGGTKYCIANCGKLRMLWPLHVYSHALCLHWELEDVAPAVTCCNIYMLCACSPCRFRHRISEQQLQWIRVAVSNHIAQHSILMPDYIVQLIAFTPCCTSCTTVAFPASPEQAAPAGPSCSSANRWPLQPCAHG